MHCRGRGILIKFRTGTFFSVSRMDVKVTNPQARRVSRRQSRFRTTETRPHLSRQAKISPHLSHLTLPLLLHCTPCTRVACTLSIKLLISSSLYCITL